MTPDIVADGIALALFRMLSPVAVLALIYLAYKTWTDRRPPRIYEGVKRLRK